MADKWIFVTREQLLLEISQGLKLKMQVTINVVWDITNPFIPRNIEFLQNENSIHYTLPTDSLREFIICDKNGYYIPVSYEAVQNQNLHSISDVDFVIISPESFLEQAHRLAGIHESVDGMDVIVVTPEQIYNEFSSGSQDVSAIRDFMRMLYSREAFGEGSRLSLTVW